MKKYTKYGLSYKIQYRCLHDMKRRCYDPTDISYSKYGGRKDANGDPDPVIVYEPWRNNVFVFMLYTMFCMPETLKEFQARNPSKAATIDRIDNKGHYVPGNIRWATRQEQNQNMSSTKLNPDLVRIIRNEAKSGKTTTEIFKILKTNYDYQGTINNIQHVIAGRTWNNIK